METAAVSTHHAANHEGITLGPVSSFMGLEGFHRNDHKFFSFLDRDSLKSAEGMSNFRLIPRVYRA